MLAPSLAVLLTVPISASVLAAEPKTFAERREEREAQRADKNEYGPFLESEAASDTAHATQPRPRRTPVLSVRDGAFCFVDGTYCKVSLIATASVAAGMRLPASDEGPDMPYAQFTFRGGFVVRPFMLGRRDWHPWGIGLVGSWSRGTGSVTGDATTGDLDETDHTDAWRVAAYNQIWLSKKQHGIHLDLSFGGVRSEILTSGIALWGTHAELGFGWGGWGGVYAGGDFLDRDTRIVFGFRGHAIAAGPIIALALAGLAMGGAL